MCVSFRGWGGWSSSETMETKLGHCTNFVLPLPFFDLVISQRFVCVWLHFHFKDAKRLSVSCGLIICLTSLGSLPRASISRDPFYDMLATRKRRIANKK